MKLVPEGPFVIMINETQRKLLISLLSAVLGDKDQHVKLLATPDPEGMHDNQFEAAHCIYDMMQDLPQNNEVCEDLTWGARGRMVHGFCL